MKQANCATDFKKKVCKNMEKSACWTYLGFFLNSADSRQDIGG